MAVAKIWSEKNQGKQGATSCATEGVSGSRLSYARAVLQWAPELVDAVLAGAESLDRAYAVAMERNAIT